jgi:hypothetical protein
LPGDGGAGRWSVADDAARRDDLFYITTEKLIFFV